MVNHVGFIVQNVQNSIAKWKAAGVPVQPGNNNRMDQAYVTTPDGLKVPVVRNAQALGLWELAAEIRRLAERARSNKATREELVGSTITVPSLGKLGGIASTPIINAPEVAIIGLNKAVERPVVHQGAVVVRRIMNLSSSFDHRFVDGYDAAAMIQALKERIEHPATIFIPTVKSS